MIPDQDKNNLAKAIKQLPSYKPREEVWDSIERQLVLQRGIRRLPTYNPTEEIWQKIEVALPAKRFNIRWKLFSIAATILLVIGWNWWSYLAGQTVSNISYAEEVINPQLLVKDWEEEEVILNQIEAYCQIQKSACIDQEFKDLEMELQELTAAKTVLEEAINNYGKDLEIIAQLSKIELERTVLLKKMMSNIL